MRSTKIFAKTFFPEEVPSEFSMLHDRIFEVIDSPDCLRKAIAAPRGLGKTTIAKIRACKAILFRESKFIVYLSNSATSAEASTEHIKRMLQSNDIIRQFFGDVKFSQEGFKDSFSKQSWVAFGEIFVLPRGAGQQVRGLNWMGNRPELIVIDDLESTESIRSDEQRDKLKKWFLSDLMKTESKYSKPAEFIYIDTIKHEDALLQNLIDSSDWKSIVLSICDEEFNTFDPNYMTTEEIKAEYQAYKEKGEADLFYMELMNVPISKENATFKPSYFKYFTEEKGSLQLVQKLNHQFKRIPTDRLMTIVICDPARTTQLHSADSSVVVVSVDRVSGGIFVRDVYAGKVKPDELYDVMFEKVLLFNARMLCVEVTGLSQFISQPIENQMRVRGIYPQYIELQAKGHKEDRVASLAPNYRLGYMYHNATNCRLLESQLEWFPKSKRWDVMDALSYINQIMAEHAIYFDPDDSDEESYANEFDELYDEEVLSDAWRSI
jgi:hypothetical protein